MPDGSRVLRWLLAVWVAALVLALYPFTADPASPIKYLLTALFAVAGAALALAAALARPWPRPGRALGVLAGFLAAFLPPALLSAHPWHTLDALIPWLLFFVMAGLAALAVRDESSAHFIFAAVVCAAVAAALYGFLQAAGMDPFPWSTRSVEEYRGLPSTYANPNFAGHVLVLAIPLALYLVWQATGVIRRVWLGAAGLLVVHLIWTNMRGGVVALIGGLAFTGIVWAARKRVRPLQLGIVLVAGGMILACAGVAAAITRSMDREEPLPLDGSLVLRLNGYYGAAQMLLDRPLLGLGPGGYALRVPVYWTPYEARWFAQTGKKNTHAHNDLLESGADGGVLGIAAYLTLMIYAVLAAVRLMQSQEPSRRGLGVVLAAAFAGFAVDGLFGFNLRVPVSSGLYFLLYGVLAGVGASATPARRWPAAGLAAACLLIACAGLAYAATTFVGERAYQFAAGARDYALQEAARGNAPASRSALAQAETALTEAALRLPGDARPWEMRGHIALMLGNAATAAAHFAEGLRRTPHYPPLLVARARALTEVLREGVERPWLYPGADLWQAGNAAELAALRARELCPPLGAAHEALGRLAVLRAQVANDPEKARAYRAMAQSHLMEALVRGGATNTGIRLELAKLAMTEHDPPAALRFLQQAVALDPRSETAWETFEKFAAAQDAWHAYEEALSQAAHALPASDPGKGALLERLAVLPGRASADAARLSAMVAEGMRCAPGRLAFWGLYLALHPESAPGAALRRAVQEFGVEITALPEPVRALIEASAESSPMLSLYAAELLLAAKQFARADAVLSTPGTEWPPRAQEAALLLHAQAMEGLGRVEEALALSTQARATGSLSARRQYARRLAIAGQREAARLEYEALLRQMSPEEPAYEVVGAEYRALLPDPPIF